MAANVLVRHFKVPVKDRCSIDISPDVQVRRVFRRLGLVKDQSIEQVMYRARELKPRFPGLLDRPAWQIGRDWCRPTTPLCRQVFHERSLSYCSRRIGHVNAAPAARVGNLTRFDKAALGYPFNRTHCRLRRRGLEKFGYVHAAARARAPTEPGAPSCEAPLENCGPGPVKWIPQKLLIVCLDAPVLSGEHGRIKLM